MKNIIFLDIDGVLTTEEQGIGRFKQECVDVLKEILDKTKSNIVISSDWRYNMHNVDEAFNENFLPQPIGRTLLIQEYSKYKLEKPFDVISGAINRDEEILEYVNRFNIENWVVIDDGIIAYGINLTKVKHKLVFTDSLIGLERKHIKEVLNILGM